MTSLTSPTPNAGNQQFFLNVLGTGTSVLVLDTLVTSVFSTPVNDFYNSQAGVSSTLFSGAVTGALLSGVDMFFSPLPDDSFTVSELDALSGFLDGGGTVFFAGDNPGFAPDPNARINAALAALGSGMLILNVALDIGDHDALPGQILPDPFTTGVTTFNYGGMSEVSGGTPVFASLEGSPFVAYEETNGQTPVPEPGILLLLGAGLVALSRRRRS
ncbi:MAG: PEP-CTERM sorting domain-containing protein [Vicinamibacteria bacterium]